MASDEQEQHSRFYRILRLPTSVDRELRDAAETSATPLRQAIAGIFGGVDLQQAILHGQARAAEVGGEEVLDVAVQLPAPLKEALKEAADAAGVKIGTAGRLILIGCRGRLLEAIQQGRDIAAAQS